MSQDETQSTTPQPEGGDTPAGQPAAAGTGAEDDAASTIGTGTSLALGCIAGTLLLIVIGLIYLAVVALL